MLPASDRFIFLQCPSGLKKIGERNEKGLRQGTENRSFPNSFPGFLGKTRDLGSEVFPFCARSSHRLNVLLLFFPNLLISRTKPCFPWICFNQALQFYPRFSETLYFSKLPITRTNFGSRETN